MTMMGDAAPLPAAWYLEPDAFVRERRFLFAESWQMIAREAALTAPGDYVCNSLAGLAVFVMRDAAGKIGAFSNACRHQALSVLDAGAGRSALLRCRYHGWTYNFDGSFKEAPPKYGPADPASAENGLKHVRLGEWRGLLFVAGSDSASELAAEMAPLDAALASHLTSPLSAAGEVTTDLICNWKLAAELLLARLRAENSIRLWHFPTAILEAEGDALTAHQLIARTHERSRIVSHVFAADAARGAQRLDAAKMELAAAKPAWEAAQAKLAETGTLESTAAPSEGLALLRARVRAAHARAAEG